MERERLLLRPREVAEQMGICRETVYTLIRNGEIPAVRFGGSVRVPADKLREAIASRFTAAQSHFISHDDVLAGQAAGVQGFRKAV